MTQAIDKQAAWDRTPMDEMNRASRPPDANQERTAQFVSLYSEHYPRLQYFLLALLPSSNDAADVLQETSLVLWNKFDTFETGSNFFAWACKIARLQTLKFYERSSHSARLFEAETLELLAIDAMECPPGPDPRLEALESCLEGLPESDRALIRRRYEPAASVNQIAQEVGVSANLLSKTLGRIRRLLLECLERKIARER